MLICVTLHKKWEGKKSFIKGVFSDKHVSEPFLFSSCFLKYWFHIWWFGFIFLLKKKNKDKKQKQKPVMESEYLYKQ